MVTRQLQVECRTESSPVKDQRSTTVPRNQMDYLAKLGLYCDRVWLHLTNNSCTWHAPTYRINDCCAICTEYKKQRVALYNLEIKTHKICSILAQ